MKSIYHSKRLKSLIGVWVLLALLAGSIYAQVPGLAAPSPGRNPPGGLPGGLPFAMAADATLQSFLRVTGSKGELTVDNPIAPHIGHRLRVRTGESEESEQVEGRTTYDHQLEAFVAAVVDGREQPTGGQDAIANMRAIDAVYRAAGMQPRGTGGG